MSSKTITLVGSVATAIWLLLIAVYVWAKWSYFSSMEPNSLGDFVAGAFGPLALFWLVCGYLQQGLELRQNTEALKLQVEELRNSVTHQAQMAEASQQQLQLEMERLQEERARDQALRDDAAPKLSVVHVSNASSYLRESLVDVIADIKNLGEDLELLEPVKRGLSGEVSVQGNLKALQTIRVRVNAVELQDHPNAALVLKLRDKIGRRHDVMLGLKFQNGSYAVELLSLAQTT